MSSRKPAHCTMDRDCLGKKWTGSLFVVPTSWSTTVGGVGEADRRISPLRDRTMTLGGEECAGSGGRSCAEAMEYAWIEWLSVVVKYSICELGENNSRRGSPYLEQISTL